MRMCLAFWVTTRNGRLSGSIPFIFDSERHRINIRETLVQHGRSSVKSDQPLPLSFCLPLPYPRVRNPHRQKRWNARWWTCIAACPALMHQKLCICWVAEDWLFSEVQTATTSCRYVCPYTFLSPIHFVFLYFSYRPYILGQFKSEQCFFFSFSFFFFFGYLLRSPCICSEVVDSDRGVPINKWITLGPRSPSQVTVGWDLTETNQWLITLSLNEPLASKPSCDYF